MKKLFVICIMLAASITFAAAQQGQRGQGQRTPEERAKAETERLGTLLSLNADQKTKIEKIELDLNKEMTAKMQNAQGNMEAFAAIREEMNKARDTKFKDVLTADQLKKYQDDRQQRQSQRGQGGGQGQGQRPRTN